MCRGGQAPGRAKTNPDPTGILPHNGGDYRSSLSAPSLIPAGA